MSASIRILSCNLFSGRASTKALLQRVVELDVDILCAQEMSPKYSSDLHSVLPHNNLFHRRIHRGNAIAARQPIAISEIRMPRRSAWAANLAPEHWPGLARNIEVINIHVSGPHTWPYFPNRVRRRLQIEALLDYHRHQNNVPHAVVGDFNSSPAWPLYRQMAASLEDAALIADERPAQPGSTWPCVPKLGVRGWLRIDHCFLWQLHATRLQHVIVSGSDHMGIVIDVGLREGRL